MHNISLSNGASIVHSCLQALRTSLRQAGSVAVTASVCGLLALATPASAQLANAQCRADTTAAVAWGPRTVAADSGRIYSSQITDDGREFYFFKRVGSRPEDYRIYRSVRTNSGWGSAEQLSLNGEYSDLYPSLSSDGTRLTFSSYRPAPGDTSQHRNAHLWMSRRQGNAWSAPEFIAASRLAHYHSGLRQDATGSLSFRLTSPDWKQASDVMLRWNGTAFASTIAELPVHPAVDYWRARSGDSLHVWGAVSGPNGLVLLQVSRVAAETKRRSPGQYFVTRAAGSGWTPMTRAAGGLGDGSPNFVWFSNDGCYVHFTRDYSEFMRVPMRTVVSTSPSSD